MDYKDAIIEANVRADNNYLGKDDIGFAKYRVYLHNFAVQIINEDGTCLFF